MNEENLQQLKEAAESWRPSLQIEASDAEGTTLVEALGMIAKAIERLASAVYEVSNSTDVVAAAGESIATAIDRHG